MFPYKPVCFLYALTGLGAERLLLPALGKVHDGKLEGIINLWLENKIKK